jgi:hypothetical protein
MPQEEIPQYGCGIHGGTRLIGAQHALHNTSPGNPAGPLMTGPFDCVQNDFATLLAS